MKVCTCTTYFLLGLGEFGLSGFGFGLTSLVVALAATSAIDYKTDAVIQKSLRNELKKDVTIITVAHRLQTIMDADKIVRSPHSSVLIPHSVSPSLRFSASPSLRLSASPSPLPSPSCQCTSRSHHLQIVLDAGKIVEFDRPSVLLEKADSEGFLKSLVDESGDREALYAVARAGGTGRS